MITKSLQHKTGSASAKGIIHKLLQQKRLGVFFAHGSSIDVGAPVLRAGKETFLKHKLHHFQSGRVACGFGGFGEAARGGKSVFAALVQKVIHCAHSAGALFPQDVQDFEFGVVAALIGTVPSVVLGGVGTVVVALLWMALFPEIRRTRTLEG